MYGFGAKQSKGRKTNGSKWPICFVFSAGVIQALFGCLQSVGQKWKHRDADSDGCWEQTLTQHHTGWSLMNDVWAVHFTGEDWSPKCQQRQLETTAVVVLGGGGVFPRPDTLRLSATSFKSDMQVPGSPGSAQQWWITYKDWKSGGHSCFLWCPVLIITPCGVICRQTGLGPCHEYRVFD